MQKNIARENKIEKLETLNKDSELHIRSLVDEHNRIVPFGLGSLPTECTESAI